MEHFEDDDDNDNDSDDVEDVSVHGIVDNTSLSPAASNISSRVIFAFLHTRRSPRSS
jgi:hypothetical protein